MSRPTHRSSPGPRRVIAYRRRPLPGWYLELFDVRRPRHAGPRCLLIAATPKTSALPPDHLRLWATLTCGTDWLAAIVCY
ncbi:MAG: hypothetical protein GWN84_21115 [Gammaproteobacteria bacterium]|nr:hypothetical protein [Gammaproteobacteria bacterium]NIR85243.1 hypothetical protein [Gammaproteobacteria bacterium]NIR88346.1 hypothetical protein [Gammaproteobacteria bacterium]NIU06308.1 hypothetical protein [Gammaproteobacteria bacterium]NIX87581.1 hypothetical protein [Gammaproteobacteria bacterium]